MVSCIIMDKYMLILVFINLIKICANTTVPYVCLNSDAQEYIFDYKTNCDDKFIASINASLWINNEIEIPSYLIRVVKINCKEYKNSPVKGSILHTQHKVPGYISEGVNTYNHFTAEGPGANHLTINTCGAHTVTGQLVEISKFIHKFSNKRPIIRSIAPEDERLEEIVYKFCGSSNIVYNECKYSINRSNYTYTWQTYEKKQYDLYLPHMTLEDYNSNKIIFDKEIHNRRIHYVYSYLDIFKMCHYRNYEPCYTIYPFTLYDRYSTNTKVLIYSDKIILPEFALSFNHITHLDVISALDNSEYYMTYPINLKRKYNESTIHEMRQEWVNTYTSLRNDSLNRKKRDAYSKFTDNNKFDAIKNAASDMVALRFNSETNLLDTVCNYMNKYTALIHALCKNKPYECITALIGMNNIKVKKEQNIYKISTCSVIYEYKFDYKMKYINDVDYCYNDIPINYTMNGIKLSGFFNIKTGEVTKNSHKTFDCPKYYYYELHDIVYYVTNGTYADIARLNVELLALKKKEYTLNLTVYHDIEQEISAMQNIPNIEDMKISNTNHDDLYKNVNVNTEYEDKGMDIDLSAISDFFSNLFSGFGWIYTLGTIIIIVIIVVVSIKCIGPIITKCIPDKKIVQEKAADDTEMQRLTPK
jgi:hypothetical protein